MRSEEARYNHAIEHGIIEQIPSGATNIFISHLPASSRKSPFGLFREVLIRFIHWVCFRIFTESGGLAFLSQHAKSETPDSIAK